MELLAGIQLRNEMLKSFRRRQCTTTLHVTAKSQRHAPVLYRRALCRFCAFVGSMFDFSSSKYGNSLSPIKIRAVRAELGTPAANFYLVLLQR